jgi:hypothetical protein
VTVDALALDSDSVLGEEQAISKPVRMIETEVKYLFVRMSTGEIKVVCLEYYLIVSKSGYSFVEILFCC